MFSLEWPHCRLSRLVDSAPRHDRSYRPCEDAHVQTQRRADSCRSLGDNTKNRAFAADACGQKTVGRAVKLVADVVDDRAAIAGFVHVDLDRSLTLDNSDLARGNGRAVLKSSSSGIIDDYLAEHFGQVSGIDIDEPAVAFAREQFNRPNLQFDQGDAMQIQQRDGSVDVVLCCHVYEHVPDATRLFDEIYRVLKPGGRLFVSDVVATSEMPESMREQAALMTGCIAGAEHIDRIKFYLKEAGFQNIKIELKGHSKELVSGWFPGSGAENYVASADISAEKYF